MKTTHRISFAKTGRILGLSGLIAALFVVPAYAVHHDIAANKGIQSLTFARHIDTNFTAATATTAMTNATTVIGTCDGTPDADQDVACQVTMQVSGAIGTFGTTGDGGDVISSDGEMNTLINSGTANVMVVTAIGFCSGPAGPGLTIIGCGNVGSRGIVSVSSLPGNLLGVEITHEFLHNQGHEHRGDSGEGPVTPGAILNPVLDLNTNILNQNEAQSMHTGPSYTAANGGAIVDPPPVIICPSPLTVECTSTTGTLKTNSAITAFLAAASATHGCEPTPTITNNAPAVFPMGLTPVKFTATDPDWLGSSSDCTVNVNVVDTTPPALTCPSPITVECTQSGGTPKTNAAIAAFLAGASAVDLCDAAPTVDNNAPALFPDGTTHVKFTAKDAEGNPSTCTADVTVVDTTPPVITCPAPITVECNSHCGVPKTDPAVVAFLAGASATDICDPSPVITNDAPACMDVGVTHVKFTATDASTNHSDCTADINVVDTTPPVITVVLNRCALWPPNHKMADITADVTVTDICDPNPTFVLTSITSNEPENGLGDGDTAPDIIGAATGTADVAFQLRSERGGTGSGRIYTIVYTASDHSGNTATATVHVEVPHDRPAAAVCSDGFVADGTSLSSGYTFAVVVTSANSSMSSTVESDGDVGFTVGDAPKPRDVPLQAADIDWSSIGFGNTAGALKPVGTRLDDVDADGISDAVILFKSADARRLIAASTLSDGPLGLHFQTRGGFDYLVSDVFALGPPVALPVREERLPIGKDPGIAGATQAPGGAASSPAPAAQQSLPRITRLAGVFPNPFDLSLSVAFELAADQPVRVAIYDLRGALVQTLRSGWLSAGRYQVSWDGRDRGSRLAPGGVYLVRFEAGGKVTSRKAVFMK